MSDARMPAPPQGMPAQPQGAPPLGGAPGGMPMGGQPDFQSMINQHMAPVVQAMALKHQEHDGRLSQLENNLNGLMHIFQAAGQAKVHGDRKNALSGAYGKDLEDLDGVHKTFGPKGLSDHILAAFDEHMKGNPDAREEHIIEFAKPWIEGERKRVGHFIKKEPNEMAGEEKPVEAGEDAGKEKDNATSPEKAEKEATGTAKGGDGIMGDKEQPDKHPGEKDKGGEAPGEKGDGQHEDLIEKMRKSIKRGVKQK